MNRPIQTDLMAKLSGEYRRPHQQQSIFTDCAMHGYHRNFLTSAGKRGNSSDLYCIYKLVQEFGPPIEVPDLPKDNGKAAELRQQGDGHFRKRAYDEATRKYNESICWAENGTEDLGLGYAARSGVCMENEEYELALFNIALAKKHNCPARLLEELTTNETRCKEQIAQGKSYANVPFPRLPMRLEKNPRIPFLAKDITMKTESAYGRCLFPLDMFEPGEVLLEEEALVAMNDPKFRFVNCNYCTEMKAFQLMPCPDCVSVMYCSQECLEKDKAGVHRFECGIMEKLNHLHTPSAIGPRMFFTGLTLFNDDVTEMRKFCESHKRTGANPLELDYRTADQLEKFKNFHQVEFTVRDIAQRKRYAFAASLYHQVYLEHPLVKSLFATEPSRKFLLRYFYDYMHALNYLNVTQWNHSVNSFFPIASMCNHSCEPDAILTGGTRHVKLISLKMVDPDEQIFVSYGPLWYRQFPHNFDNTRALFNFECECKVCNPFQRECWLSMGTQLSAKSMKHYQLTQMVVADPRAPMAAKMNILRQFIDQFDYVYPNDEICSVLNTYHDLLRQATTVGKLAAMRSEARERAEQML